MSRINLLPWRVEHKNQRQKDFIGLLGLAALASIGVMLLVHLVFEGRIENQKNRNAYIQKETVLLDKKIKEINGLDKKKNELVARMQVIQSLQASRAEVVHMFDQLARTVPEGVYLRSFGQSGTNLTITGQAQSNTRVSAYLHSLEASPWLKRTNLNIIRSTGVGSNGFTLKVTQDKGGEAKVGG
jgi:type IV pilus assembly protein PilN